MHDDPWLSRISDDELLSHERDTHLKARGGEGFARFAGEWVDARLEVHRRGLVPLTLEREAMQEEQDG